MFYMYYMPTTRESRVSPATTWDQRLSPDTDWWERSRPLTYMTPLEDAYTEVADEDDEIIYILANSWHLIPATFWKEREPI
jgi:hypothetical protein